MGRVERPAALRRRYLLGAAKAVLHVRRPDHSRRHGSCRASTVFDRAAPGGAVAPAASCPLARARRAGGTAVALSLRTRPLLLRRQVAPPRTPTRAGSVATAHALPHDARRRR